MQREMEGGYLKNDETLASYFTEGADASETDLLLGADTKGLSRGHVPESKVDDQKLIDVKTLVTGKLGHDSSEEMKSWIGGRLSRFSALGEGHKRGPPLSSIYGDENTVLNPEWGGEAVDEDGIPLERKMSPEESGQFDAQTPPVLNDQGGITQPPGQPIVEHVPNPPTRGRRRRGKGRRRYRGRGRRNKQDARQQRRDEESDESWSSSYSEEGSGTSSDDSEEEDTRPKKGGKKDGKRKKKKEKRRRRKARKEKKREKRRESAQAVDPGVNLTVIPQQQAPWPATDDGAATFWAEQAAYYDAQPPQEPDPYQVALATIADSMIPFTQVTIIKEIGGGEFGKVYLAQWRGSLVAIKKLLPHTLFGGEQWRRFLREAIMYRRASHHPNVASFLGVCYNDSPDEKERYHLYILSEYYHHGSLQTYLRKQQQLSWLELMLLAKGAAAGLMHMHAIGVTHRDIATRNMLIDRDGKSVRVIDFGLAKEDDDVVNLASIAGAPTCAAPETLQSGEYNEYTDAYGFGVMLWEIASRGEEPFRREMNEKGIKTFGNLVPYVLRGMRPRANDTWHFLFRVLMSWCWHPDMKRRPFFWIIWKVLNEYCRLLYRDGEEVVGRMTPEKALDIISNCCVDESKQGERIATFWQTKGLLDEYLSWRKYDEGEEDGSEGEEESSEEDDDEDEGKGKDKVRDTDIFYTKGPKGASPGQVRYQNSILPSAEPSKKPSSKNQSDDSNAVKEEQAEMLKRLQNLKNKQQADVSPVVVEKEQQQKESSAATSTSTESSELDASLGESLQVKNEQALMAERLQALKQRQLAAAASAGSPDSSLGSS